MKYGILNHTNGAQFFWNDLADAAVNIGDYMQGWGVWNAYEQMNIDKNQIVYCQKYPLEGFCPKEKVILVMNNMFSGYGINGALNSLPTPDWVIPLFIGFNCHDEAVISENESYFRKWQPVGCRDEKTKELMLRHGIEAYLTGCSSILLERRKSIPKEPKVYIVDVTPKLMQVLPEKYKREGIFISHRLKCAEYADSCNDDMFFNSLCLKMIEEYKEHAGLVISARLHCIAPCMAMGIPVIMARDNVDFRYGWLDKFIPLYSQENYENIDWNGALAEVEEAKELLLNVFREEIAYRSCPEKEIEHLAMKRIDAFYNSREKSIYNEGIHGDLKKIFRDEKRNYEIMIWGAGRTGGTIYEIIKSYFKNVRVVNFIDKYRKGMFKGVKIVSPEEVQVKDDNIVLLCSLPGKGEAVSYMNKLGLLENVHYFQMYLDNY